MGNSYIAVNNQQVALNSPIIFVPIVSNNCNGVYNNNGTGTYILRGNKNCNRCTTPATYQVTFSGNIALPEDAEDVVPIAVAIVVNGEEIPASKAIYTPAAVDEYGNVTSPATIQVPRDCCFTLSVEHTTANPDPAITPAPVINVLNGTLSINRIA